MNVDEEQDATGKTGEIAPSSSGAANRPSTKFLNSSEEVVAPPSTVNAFSSEPDNAKADGETIIHNIREETIHKPANNDTHDAQQVNSSKSSIVQNSNEESVAINRGINAETEEQVEDMAIERMNMYDLIAHFNAAYGIRSHNYEFEWNDWAAED